MARLPPTKPWWPDRVERFNPDDPDDLSGRPVVPPKDYEETLMNEAGGDDKGIVREPPDATIDRRFRFFDPDLVDESLNSDAGFTNIDFKPMTPAERKQAVQNLQYWAGDESNARLKAWYLDIAGRLQKEDEPVNGR